MPPLYRSEVLSVLLHSVLLKQPPQKNFSPTMSPIDPLKNFFQKNPLTPPLSSHTVSYKMEMELNSA